MKNKDFDMLVASIKEAGDIKAGRKAPSRVFSMNPPDIKKIRETLHVSQSEFALMIGVSVRTGPAKALLRVASRNPKAVLDALHTQ
jgi:putative transcriptional regulator